MEPLVITNIKRYDKQAYESGLVKFTDFVHDKYDIVHKQLYEDALAKFVKEKAEELNITPEEYKRINTIIEYKNEEYYRPSHILVISKTRPYTKNVYSLLNYWNMYYFLKKHHIYTILRHKENDIQYEIINIDYIRNTVTLESRITGDIIETSFDNLDSRVFMSEDLTLKNTFGEKYKQLKK